MKNNLLLLTNILLTIIFKPHQIMNLKIIKVFHPIQHQECHSIFMKRDKKVLKKEENYKNKMLNKNLKFKFLIAPFIRIFLNLRKK